MKAAVTILVICVASLLALGMVMLYSAQMAQSGAGSLVKQLTWCGLGVAACFTAAAMDYRILKKLAWPMFAFAVILLVLVFIPPIGIWKKGASRWIGFGGLTFQPSEFAKLALIVVLAWYGERYQRQMPTCKRGIVIPGIFIGLILGLIFIEPDRGTTILVAAIAGAMLLTAGVRWRYFLPPILLGVVGLVFSILHDPMRMKRIFSWLDVEEHRTGAGWQVYHSMLALGTGGWTGVGLGNSRQKLGFIPEHDTDFMLPIIGEELGLIATLLVLVAFAAIVLCGICISLRSRDTFGMLLGCGITFLIGLQALINIAVVTGALPNKGLPLPFISRGGSNLVVMLACVGILLSIARQARAPDQIPAAADELPAPQPA